MYSTHPATANRGGAGIQSLASPRRPFLSLVPDWRLIRQPHISHAGFVAIWEAQSQLATLAYVSLVAMASIWLALPVMLAWSLTAVCVYCVAREKGQPDLLQAPRATAPRFSPSGIRAAGVSFVKVWLAGFQAFLYSRASRSLLDTRPTTSAHRAARIGVLAVGLTLFGVSTAEHLLRRAGYSRTALVRLGMVGAAMNVSYRVFLSALVVHLARGLLPLAHFGDL